MTDILCKWLNDELRISMQIDQASFAKEFASGYLIGEVLHKYQLQDDFDQFSQSKTADSKLNNFTRLEPMLHLLGIPFDTNLARDIMTEKHGTATRLLYQMYIALNNKKKANLTGVAMETLRPAAPAKLGLKESEIYKEENTQDKRLKHATPRQTDLNLQALVGRFHQHQIRMEQTAFKERFEDAERLYQQRQNDRNALIDRSRRLREKQSELVAKINAASVHIPKPPPNHTLKAIQARNESRRKRESELTVKEIHNFEEKMKMILPPSDEGDEVDIQYIMTRDEDRGEPIHMLRTAPNDEYIGKIRKRLQEDAAAREEREKRRRKVLGDQMLAHEAQEEARREEMMVNRLMRQSQQERRIAVQLLQARHEKEVIRQNRIFREKQYQDRRLKDFEDALDLEAEMAALHKIEYAEQIKADQYLHDKIAAQRAEERYKRHYDMCAEMVSSVVDFSCKVAEYRELTNNLLPAKLMREWKLLFTSGQPLYEKVEQEVSELTPEQVLEEDRQQLLDEGDFMEYKNMNGEWQAPEASEIEGPPRNNPVVGHIVQRLFNIVHPPTPPPPPPEFAPFPVRACVLGKVFSGKTSCVKRLAEEHRLEVLVPEQLVHEAVEAHKAGELETQDETTQVDFGDDDADDTLSGQEAAPPADESVVEEQPSVADAISEVVSQSGDTAPGEVAATPATEPVTVEKSGSQAGTEPPGTAGSTKRELSTDLTKSSTGFRRSKANAGPQPTARAKLGSKALKFLKKGRPVDDQIVVDVIIEAIRRVPEGTGWILDGYPQNYNQAKMLEKSLSGYDGNARETAKREPKIKRKSSLVPDPRPPPPPPDPPSGIDVVVLFDIRDELCLKRAAGRVEQIQAEKTFHEEFNPPPEGSATGVGNTEKVQPVKDQAYDQEQIQTRITGFLDQWSKLEKWFQRFGTLKTVDASLEKDSVYFETEKILEDTLCKIQKKDQEEVAAATAEAEKIEEKEAPGAPPELPPEPPKEEAAPGGPDVRTSRPSSKAGSRAGAEGETESENEKSGSGSAETGENKSNEISGTSEQESGLTEEKSDLGCETEKPNLLNGPVEFNVNITVDLSKALVSDGDDAGSAKSGGSKKSKSPKGKKSDTGSAKDKKGSRGSSPKSAGKKGSKKSKTPEPEPEPEPEEPSGPPPPKPGDEEWEFVDLDVDDELAKVLVLHWEETEKTYVNNCKTVFRNLRGERENIYRYFFQIRKDFLQYLRRPDSKQEFIEQWQKTYNEVPDDMRDDEETRAELHQQIDDLKEKLWSICDERKEQAENERETILNDGWLDDHLGVLSNHYLTVMQAEVDRLQDTVRLLKDYYRGMDGQVPDALNPDYERLPLIELPVERPETPEGAGSEGAQSPVDDSRSDRSASARSKSPKGGRRSKSPKERAKSPKGSKSSRAASGKKKKGGKETPQPEVPKSSEGIGRRIVIPLVPRRPMSPDADAKTGATPSKDKKDKKGAKKGGTEEVPGAESPAPPQDLDEKLIFDGFTFAINAISQMIQAEMQAREAEEEAEKLKQQELEKEKEKNKGVKGGKGGKKGKSRSPSPKKGGKGKDSETSGTPPPAPSEVSEEEQQKKSAKERAREEFYFSIQEEEQASKVRLDLIRQLACAVLQDLKSKGEDAFKDMNDWLGARFLKEMESIDQMAEVTRNAVENREKIKYTITLDQDNFVLDEDLKVLKTPSPAPPPPPTEVALSDQFTVAQLRSLYEQFRATAPTGIISSKAFVEMFENLVLVTQGMESLPDMWMQLTPSQIQELANTLSSETDYVDWRRLFVSLCSPIPIPTQQQLLDSLQRFKEMDQIGSGTVTREQWQRMSLWFSPEDTLTGGFDRLAELQKALFEIFADHTKPISALFYESFLMYFSAAPNYHEGFLRALSVTGGQHIPRLGKPSLTSLATQLGERVPSIVDSIIQEGTDFKDDEKTHSEPPMSEEVIPSSADDALVSVEALFKVLHHGEITKGDSHRFSVMADPEDQTSTDRLTAVFKELNDDDTTSPIPYKILIDHPLIQDVVVACKHFKALDIKSLLAGSSADIAEVTSLKTMD
ncbi:sperm flagellar protein 2 isoform X2 [Aplysia californica]|uniref:Sperm flagellar protein 2 isoform X2 n=1 Tax=Aplysia californica TaxID=6500 RepID=A0ABM0JSG7_APLCA|nr:sperm flagellar protein 2 isoform X2 [Aplysia californica]